MFRTHFSLLGVVRQGLLLALFGLLVFLLGLLLGLGQMGVQVEGPADVVPVAEGALLDAHHQIPQVGVIVEGVAEWVRHILVEELQLSEIRERDDVQLMADRRMSDS